MLRHKHLNLVLRLVQHLPPELSVLNLRSANHTTALPALMSARRPYPLQLRVSAVKVACMVVVYVVVVTHGHRAATTAAVEAVNSILTVAAVVEVVYVQRVESGARAWRSLSNTTVMDALFCITVSRFRSSYLHTES
jgi:hypothetical protein